jgi:hypothetical protein
MIESDIAIRIARTEVNEQRWAVTQQILAVHMSCLTRTGGS